MASVAFLRAVNVGGRRVQLGDFVHRKSLADLGLVNLGAAGTLVTRTSVPAARLRAALAAELPFDCDIAICPGADIQRLAARDPFGPLASGAKPYVTILIGSPTASPDVPLHAPSAAAWEVQVVGVEPPFVLSQARRLTERLTYPNPVVEKAFGVPATTRGWPTILAVAEILAGPPGSGKGRAKRVGQGAASGGK
jgi:uncharacterized protein (DUF1697 family)